MVVAALWLALPAGQLAADAPDASRVGLLWNRTGLPLVFPLLVKTLPGNDFRLVLSDAQTGAEAVAAAFPGGEPFRLLVPPGSFLVRIAPEAGARSPVWTLGPLTFRIAGVGRKEGYLIDLTGAPWPEAVVRPIALCPRAADEAGAGQDWTPPSPPDLPPNLLMPVDPLSPVGPMPQPDWMETPTPEAQGGRPPARWPDRLCD